MAISRELFFSMQGNAQFGKCTQKTKQDKNSSMDTNESCILSNVITFCSGLKQNIV